MKNFSLVHNLSVALLLVVISGCMPKNSGDAFSDCTCTFSNQCSEGQTCKISTSGTSATGCSWPIDDPLWGLPGSGEEIGVCVAQGGGVDAFKKALTDEIDAVQPGFADISDTNSEDYRKALIDGLRTLNAKKVDN